MSNFKPSLFYRSNKSIREAQYNSSKTPYVTKSFKTYRELKKNLKEALLESFNNEVNISRSRRGEWGEWYETWSLVNNRPKLINATWL